MIGRKRKGGWVRGGGGEGPPEAAVARAAGPEGLGLGEGLGEGLGVGVLAGAGSTVKAEQRLPLVSLTQTWWVPGGAVSGTASWIEKLPFASVLRSTTWLLSKSTARMALGSNPLPLKLTRAVGGAEPGFRRIDPRGVGTGVGVGVGVGLGLGLGLAFGLGLGLGDVEGLLTTAALGSGGATASVTVGSNAKATARAPRMRNRAPLTATRQAISRPERL